MRVLSLEYTSVVRISVGKVYGALGRARDELRLCLSPIIVSDGVEANLTYVTERRVTFHTS